MTKTKKQRAAEASERRKRWAGGGLLAAVAAVAVTPLVLDDRGSDIGKTAQPLPAPTGWYDTGDIIQTTDGPRRLYARKFPAGRVELGGNECKTNGCSMYSVILLGNPCPADLNDDGVVNFADLAVVRMHLYTSNPAGDANMDGIVNPADAGYIAERAYTEC